MRFRELINQWKIFASVITIILANFLIFQNTLVGIMISVVIFIYYGKRLGRFLFPQNKPIIHIILGGFIWLVANSLLLTACFYLYKINALTIITSLSITLFVIEKFCIVNQEIEPIWTKLKFNGLRVWLYSIAYIITIGGYFFIIFKHRTAEAITGPWNIIPSYVFVLFALATFFLIKILSQTKKTSSVWFLIIHFFSISGVAGLLYFYGYGFDPFLHLAGMKNILATGTLTPLPFYYIGEYSLVLYLHYLTRIDLESLNIFLVPGLFSLISPIVITNGLKYGFNLIINKALITGLMIFVLPISMLINTTPHGLNVFLALIIIFYSLWPRHKYKSLILILLALFSVATHVLYGLPLLFFVLFNIFHKPILKWAMALISCFIVPLMFLANAVLNKQKISFGFNYDFLFKDLWLTNIQYQSIWDFLYSYGLNFRIIFVILAIFGLILAVVKKSWSRISIYALFAGTALINFLFLKTFVSLDFVAIKNAGDFQLRILDLCFYFLLPIVLYLFAEIWQQPTKAIKYFAYILTIIVISMSLYLSYPQKNDYYNSKSFNVSENDLQMVHLINDHATQDYIVLGNQITAATAIKEFGFAHYYNDQFYYSIPTNPGHDLNDFYEQMTYHYPDRKTAIKAMDFAGVEQLYLTVHDYWPNYTATIENAKKNADHFWEIGNGQAFIFLYQR